MKISTRFTAVIFAMSMVLVLYNLYSIRQFISLGSRSETLKTQISSLMNISDMELYFSRLVISALDILHTGDISEKKIVEIRLSFSVLEKKLKELKGMSEKSEEINRIITLSEELVSLSRNEILDPIFNRRQIDPGISDKIIYEIMDPLRMLIKNESGETGQRIDRNYREFIISKERYLKIILPAVIFLMIILFIYLYMVLLKGINAVKRLTLNLESISSRKASLEIRLPEDGNDETAVMGKSFNSFISSLSDMMGELVIISELHSRSGVDLSDSVIRVSEQSRKAEHNIGNILNEYRELSEGISGVNCSLNSITGEIIELSSDSADLKTIFSDTEKIIAGSVLKQNRLIEKSVELIDTSDRLKKISESGNSSMNVMGNKIDSIEGSIKKINSRIDEIDLITEKLDVIAINTAIEAAHAGVYGKGFEVIAKEFRKLSGLLNDYNKNTASLMCMLIDDVNDLNMEKNTTMKSIEDILMLNENFIMSFINTRNILEETSESGRSTAVIFSGLQDKIGKIDSAVSAILSEIKDIKYHFEKTDLTYKGQYKSLESISSNIISINEYTRKAAVLGNDNIKTLEKLNHQIEKFRPQETEV